MMSKPLALVNLTSIYFRATRRAATTRVYSSINCNTPYNICFVRHGQSTWNRDNRFIGWTDTPLTEDGVLEARVAGRMLQSSGILFDEAHTVSDGIRSLLLRVFALFLMYLSNANNVSLYYDEAFAPLIWFWWKWGRWVSFFKIFFFTIRSSPFKYSLSLPTSHLCFYNIGIYSRE